MRGLFRTGGILRRPAAGKLGCCCDLYGCPGSGVTTVQVVFSGVDWCSGVSYTGYSQPVDGAFTLTWNAGTSRYRVFLPAVSGYLQYIEAACSLVSGGPSFQWHIYALFGAGFSGRNSDVFEGTSAVGTPLVASNTLVCTGLAASAGHNGTATISW